MGEGYLGAMSWSKYQRWRLFLAAEFGIVGSGTRESCQRHRRACKGRCVALETLPL